MDMKYTMKKVYALLLTVVMLVNIFPVSAFAGTDEARVGSFSLNNSRNAGDESHIVRLVDNVGQYSRNTYVVFMQKIPNSSDYGYWYKQVNGVGWNEDVKSFTVPYRHEIECKFNKDEDFQLRVFDGNDIYYQSKSYPLNWYTASQKAGSGSITVKGSANLRYCFVAQVFNDDDTYWSVELRRKSTGEKIGSFKRLANKTCTNIAATA